MSTDRDHFDQVTYVSKGFEDWVRDVYQPALGVIAGAFSDATGCGAEASDHFARAVMARLMHLDPPITLAAVEL